jgi:hypothetical protein
LIESSHRRLAALLAVVLLCAFGAGTARGQLTSSSLPPARAGMIAGLNISSVGGGGSTREGLVAGATLVTPFTPVMAFQLEGLFSMKGGVNDGAATTPATLTTSALRLDYVEIPVMLHVEAPLASRVRPYAYTGPEISVRVNEPGIMLNRVDPGWILGGGLQFDIAGRALAVSMRYDAGLRSVYGTGDGAKNRVLSFVASIERPLPQKAVR